LETVGRSLTDAVRKLLRMPNVDEKAIKELVKDLQRTLLQADVNVELVLQLSKAVEDRSLKASLPPGITRREHVVKVLYEEMTKFVGQDPAKVEVQPGVFRKLMLVGIQGTGKTTSSVKLARFFQKRGLRVGIVGADTYRPGALEQLRQLAARVEIPVYGEPGTKKPEDPPWKYVEAFAGSDIETNPPATNDAVQKSGRILTRHVDELPPKEVLDEIDRVFDVDHMEKTLMEEGLKKFADPQKALLKLIADKRKQLGGTTPAAKGTKPKQTTSA